jgi:hypothetical protein
MGAAANARTVGEIAPWHAMSGAEVLKRLGANGEKGLDGAVRQKARSVSSW